MTFVQPVTIVNMIRLFALNGQVGEHVNCV